MSAFRASAALGSLLLIAILGACSGEDTTGPEPVVNTVEVSPSTGTLNAIGATVEFTAVARDSDGDPVTDATFEWSSGSTGVATVSDGLVTAVDNGTAEITASAGGVSGSSEVTVEQEISSVVVTPSAVDSLIGEGDEVQFEAEAQDANANAVAGATFTWTSSDSDVATVDDTGLVTAVTNGTTTVTAEEAGGETGTASFKSATVEAMEAMTIDVTVDQDGGGPHHPMGITSDGSSYFSIYDGSSPSPILTHDLDGNFVSETTATGDARALLYSEAEDDLFMKTFDNDWYSVDPVTGSRTLILSDIFDEDQSSPAFLSGGATILEHAPAGTVRMLDATDGSETGTLTGLQTGASPSDGAVATDGSFIFTWDGTTVFMYDLQGRLVTSFDIPSGDFGFTLSYANGMLWTADDIATGTNDGTWFGYELVKQ